MHRNPRSLVLAAAGALLLAAPASGVLAATPVETGCPASATLTSVAYLESIGPYQLPGRLDDPANGGNGDGWVCAFPLPEAMATAHGASFTIYQFFENTLTSRKP
jgi:hypothetical protein